MAGILGPARDRLLQTRRSPLRIEAMVCTACTKATGAFVTVRKCRVFYEGLNRPGVTCPTCHTAWIEQEDQPEAQS